MALSEAALDELAAEYRRIMAEADQLRSEAQAIESFLRRYNRSTEETTGRQVRLVGKSQVEPITEEQTGLRSTIVRVLAGADRGYRPAEMKDALLRRGFTENGDSPKTPLGIRVGSEMARLFRDGKITKARDGRYTRLHSAPQTLLTIAEGAGRK